MISKMTMTLKQLLCFLHFKAFSLSVTKLSYTSSVNSQKRLYSSSDCSWALFVPDEQVDSGTLFVYILLPFLFLFFLCFTCLFVLFDPLSSQGSIKFHLILGTQRHTSSGRQPFIFHPSTHKPCFSLCNVETGHFL